MAVSKRIRFEILRRDQHTCRYCRSTDNPLTVDHVIPVALGGTDTPDNLVAACRDCNAGKSSAAPDSSLVVDVREDALRHAELIKQAYAVLIERMGDRDKYVRKFKRAFGGDPMPDDWKNTVQRWFDLGVPAELVVDAAQKASRDTRAFRGTGRFTWCCGIVWNQVRAVDYCTQIQETISGSFLTTADVSQLQHSSYGEGYQAGYDRGRIVGSRTGWDDGYYARQDELNREICGEYV